MKLSNTQKIIVNRLKEGGEIRHYIGYDDVSLSTSRGAIAVRKETLESLLKKGMVTVGQSTDVYQDYRLMN